MFDGSVDSLHQINYSIDFIYLYVEYTQYIYLLGLLCNFSICTKNIVFEILVFFLNFKLIKNTYKFKNFLNLKVNNDSTSVFSCTENYKLHIFCTINFTVARSLVVLKL